MKGCSLKCYWCASSSLLKKTPEILHDAGKCRKCKSCTGVCPKHAIEYNDQNNIVIDQNKCDGCGLCMANCILGALTVIGKDYTVEKLLNEVEKDSLLCRQSGGGVTVSGGEPALQSDFVTAFLEMCQQRHLRTAMETGGYAPWRIMQSLIASSDLVYFHINHMNDQIHQRIMGVSNRLILENIKRTAEHCPIILRVPIVPGLNDASDNIVDTAAFAKSLGDRLMRVELLPFYGRLDGICQRFNGNDSVADLHVPEEEITGQALETIKQYGLKVQIGG